MGPGGPPAACAHCAPALTCTCTVEPMGRGAPPARLARGGQPALPSFAWAMFNQQALALLGRYRPAPHTSFLTCAMLNQASLRSGLSCTAFSYARTPSRSSPWLVLRDKGKDQGQRTAGPDSGDDARGSCCMRRTQLGIVAHGDCAGSVVLEGLRWCRNHHRRVAAQRVVTWRGRGGSRPGGCPGPAAPVPQAHLERPSRFQAWWLPGSSRTACCSSCVARR